MTTTKTTMALAGLVEKGADADLLRQMIQHIAQRLMDMDVEGLCQAAYGERTAERANSRNGYRNRQWDTWAGSVDLRSFVSVSAIVFCAHEVDLCPWILAKNRPWAQPWAQK